MTIATAPPPPPVEFGAVFSRAWKVFKENWIVALPPIIAGVAAMVVVGIFIALMIAVIGVSALGAMSSHGHAPARGAVAGLVGIVLLGTIVLIVVGLVLGLWSQTAMYGMADAAWTRGTTSLGDGFAAFRTRGGAVFVAWIGVFLLSIVALILFIPTLSLSVIALSFVTMYVFPAAVAGGQGGFEAVGESFRLIRRFFGPSIITWLVLYAIQYGISLVLIVGIVPAEFAAMPTGPDSIPRIPPIPLLAFGGLSYIVGLVLLLAYSGFLATVQVGMYHTLRAQPDPEAYPRIPPPPPPPAVPQY